MCSDCSWQGQAAMAKEAASRRRAAEDMGHCFVCKATCEEFLAPALKEGEEAVSDSQRETQSSFLWVCGVEASLRSGWAPLGDRRRHPAPSGDTLVTAWGRGGGG